MQILKSVLPRLTILLVCAIAPARAATEIFHGIPFSVSAKPASLIKENEPFRLPTDGVAADTIFLLGGTNSIDRGSPGWRARVTPRNDRFFLGTEIGAVGLEYADGTKQRIGLIFGVNVWWHQIFYLDGYQAPFDTPQGKALLAAALHALPTGKPPPAAFVIAIRPEGKPLAAIVLSDTREKNGAPVVSSVTLRSSGGQWLAAGKDHPPRAMPSAALLDNETKVWIDRHALSAGNFQERVDASLRVLRAAMYTSEDALAAKEAIELQMPPQYTGPRAIFRGHLSADLLTNLFHHNLADMLVKTEGGRYRTSSPGATNFGRYNGFGTWKTGVGWNDTRAWSRDFGAALIELAELGFQQRAEDLTDYAFKWARWYVEQKITYPDGTPTPAHWSRVIDDPQSKRYHPQRQGSQENDGHGMLMLATYKTWQRTGDRVAWARQRWPDFQAAAEWICWQFENPRISRAKHVLYTEGESARAPHTSIYADIYCSEALRAYAEIADAVGDAASAQRWRDRVARMEPAMLRFYPTAGADGRKIWKQAWSWAGHYPMLGPIMVLPDRRGFDVSDAPLPGFDAINVASYLTQLHEHAPEPWPYHAVALGYGQAYISQSALILDRMAEATALVEVLARLSYFPGHQPFIVPEGVEWTDDRKFWHRTCDLGNGVQQAAVMKVIRLLVGVDDNLPAAPKILPRLPDGWQSIEIADFPIMTTRGPRRIAMTYSRAGRGGFSCDVAADAPAGNVQLRLGPFADSTATQQLHVEINDRPASFQMERRGDRAWAWTELPAAVTGWKITAAVQSE